MSRKYTLTPQAEYDLDLLAKYIARDNIEAAIRLYNRAEETFENLSQTPFIGAKHKSQYHPSKDIRFCSIKNFARYIVFYEVLIDKVRVIRILHSARDIDALLIPSCL